MTRYEQDARDIEAGAAAEVAAEAIEAARRQFAAELTRNEQPDGLAALYAERTERSTYERSLIDRREALNKTLNRATRQSTISKTNIALDDLITAYDLNHRALEALGEQIEAKRAERDAAVAAVANAFLVELLSDFGRVQFDNPDRPDMPTHVEFTPTGPLADGSTYAIVVRGASYGYAFEVGLRGGEGERFLRFDVDVAGPRAATFGEDKVEPSAVNWPAFGSQPVAVVKQFARVLDIAAQLAQRLDECLLPE